MFTLAKMKDESCPTLSDPVDYIARQALLSVEFSRQDYWSGLPLISLEDLLNLGIESGSPELQVDSLPPEPPGKPTFIPTVTKLVCVTRFPHINYRSEIQTS